MSASGGTKAIIAAFFANLGIAVAKFVGFVFTGSASLLAESIHSVADTGNQGLLLLGRKRAAKAPDDEHPFGYARERYFWAFVVALVLFALGALFAIGEGISKIRHPHELESVWWAIGILVFAIVLEGFSFRTAMHEAGPHRGNATWLGYVRRAKEPELPVVLLEDTGALVGLVLALAAVGMAELTGDARWDGIGTLCIGILLAVIAILLAVEMKGLLIGEGASVANVTRIRAAIEGSPDVVRIIHLRTEHLGPEELLVGTKVMFREGLTMVELADAIDGVEARVRAVVPIARPFYVEPDIFRPEGTSSSATPPAGR